MNWIIRQIARITLLGKLVEKLGPKVPIIFILLSLIFVAFYIPYEYENILEFRKKYPNDVCAVVKQPKQFSWYSDGKSEVRKEKEA